MQLFAIPAIFRKLSRNKYRQCVGWTGVFRERSDPKEKLLSIKDEYELVQKILKEVDWVTDRTAAAAASSNYYIWLASGRPFVKVWIGIGEFIYLRNGSQEELWNKLTKINNENYKLLLDRWCKHVQHI